MSTIVAISTAPGIGGIGIIRMSGTECFEILSKIFKPKTPESIEKIKGYTIKYGYIIDSINNEVFDEVLVSYFKMPNSYTAENVCEINSHGGVVIIEKILQQCLKNGAVLAEPGEFTKRAFLNGRIDLTQAEAVIDVINSKTETEAKASVMQLEGYLSESINIIRKDLLDLLVDIEASIDYPEYDVEEVTNAKAKENLGKIRIDLERLILSFKEGKIIKNGIRIAILGSPNAGKSSLLNEILKEDRAIVTEYAGTTRDIIEEEVIIGGVPFIIIDTAGIRESDNIIEKIGIEKTKKIAESSDLIIAMFDNSKNLSQQDEEIIKLISNKQAIVVLNKTDLEDKLLEENEQIISLNKKIIKISVKNKQGVEQIYKELIDMYNINNISLDNNVVITNLRHKNLLEKALNSTNIALQALEEKMPIDIIAINIKDILEYLGKITGQTVSEDVIKEIFSKFCLGK